MPATEDVWRSLKVMHAWFAVSALALLVATLWMLQADYADEWRGIQDMNVSLKAEQSKAEIASLANDEFKKTTSELAAKKAAAEEAWKAKQSEIEPDQKKLSGIEAELALLIRNTKFKRAERDKFRADLDLAVRDELPAKIQEEREAAYRAKQAEVDQFERKVQDTEDTANQLRSSIANARAQLTAAETELKKHEADLVRLDKALLKLKPEPTSVDAAIAAFKLWTMKLPIIDGFNGPQKVLQVWLPELTINFGGMKDVPRFDRCITCHLNIDAVKAGNKPAFPYDAHGMPEDEHHAAAAAHVSSGAGYRHPYATHPRTDVYMTAASPHPIQKFGCTICHEGQGSATSFHNAQHTPDSPAKGDEWHEKYGWFYNHFWEYPMRPGSLTESSCIKCHHNVVELGINEKYGATAPTVYKGFDLVRKYGCFGCHEINGYSGDKQIGPDMRLEPTKAELAAMGGEEPGNPGTYRKVGPGMRHFNSKTTIEWTKYWLNNPQDFRPDTKMPKFFNLLNQQDHDGKRFNPVEIAGIASYLHDKSESSDLLTPKAGYVPDAARGKKLFSQKGCLSCHKHDDFPGVTADFGPNITRTHQKMKPGSEGFNWLYTWLREPTRHSPDTKMPNLYLVEETLGKEVIDPAADITAYLLQGDATKFDSPEYDPAALKDLVRVFLKGKVLTEKQTDEFLADRKYPITDRGLVKGDEIELLSDDGVTTDAMLLRYVGRRTISRYGCYACHEIPGFEKGRPIGVALADWGRKDPTKLALEHITEYLKHHGEKDGSSTEERIHDTLKLDASHAFKTPEEREKAVSPTYFYNQLLSHGRGGFLWQKLRESRSYDYKKIETKGYDERLRMPQFPFNEEEIHAVATFILGLVNEPPRAQYVYKPTGPAKTKIAGEHLIAKYNCSSCHMLKMPEVEFAAKPEDIEASAEEAADLPQARELLMQLKRPRNGVTGRKSKSGDPIVSFHGLPSAVPNPDDAPEDQEYIFDLWETLKVDDKVVFPASKLIVKATQLETIKPARGGEFAQWLVGDMLANQPELNRNLAWQASPPPLYLEGLKIQTPWLYTFLKNPQQIRYTTVLRMPRFNMTDTEAQVLAEYFAAVDDVPAYTDVPQRTADYLAAHGSGYLPDSWKLLNGNLCVKCHALGGRPYTGGQSKEDIRGPNLDAVANRLRPDWLQLWIYKPSWVTPYTSMPQNYPADKQTDPLFGGDAGKQNTAIRDALMNYYKLLETEGRITQAAVTPAAAADADPAANPPAAGGGE